MKNINRLLLKAIAVCIQTTIIMQTGAQPWQGQSLVDSLEKQLPVTKNDTAKANIYYRLSLELSPNNNETAFKYADQCMQLSTKANWKKGIAMAFYAYSNAYVDISDYTTSQVNSIKAFDLFKALGDKKNMAFALRITGIDYDMLGYYTKALENHFAALQLFETLNDKAGIQSCHNNIGSVYYSMYAFDKAIMHYNIALKECRELNDKVGIASAFDNIASVYTDIKKYDSAGIYNMEAIKIFEAINYQSSLSKAYYNRGNLLMKLNDAKIAYDYYIRAIKLDKKLDSQLELADDYGAIGSLYLTLAKDTTAKYSVSSLLKKSKHDLLLTAQYYFSLALSMSKEGGNINLMMDYADLSAQTEESLGNYQKAFAFHKAYVLYRDSIYNDENRKKIASLENLRLAEVKDKEIQLLNKDKALQASEITRQTELKNIIITVVILTAFALFFITRLFSRKRKAMFEKKVLQMEMKALRAQMNPHFIFNSLHSINKYVIENDKHLASAYLTRFAKLMRLVLENSRATEVPLQDDLDALELYMQLEALRFQNGFRYYIVVHPSIDSSNTLIPPLLIQPFVENAILHGIQDKEGGVIKIMVDKENDMMRCVVEDNGTGRQQPVTNNIDENKKRTALGMKIINERLDIINQMKKIKTVVHIFDISDEKNRPGGLKIELLLPLQYVF
ncbi:hypothetical protein BH10BAC2_BH10BAC2_39930 [soil metagenome]